MKKQLGGVKILITILIIVIIIAGALFGLKIYKDKEVANVGEFFTNVISLGTDIGNKEEEKQVQIFNGTDRPIAVMIDNVSGAKPQAGLNDAYAVYEIIVEGGLTRLMAVFKGVDVDKIGPVRSSRHYFLDYALENDAIYVHYGWSPQAQSDISSLGVSNINGLTESIPFWRVSDKSSPHNVATSIEKILEVAENKEYRQTSSQESVLNYVTDEVILEEGQIADEVIIPYPTDKVKFVYNEQTKRYTRYVDGEKQTDWVTDEDVTTKNIIITFAQNVNLDSTGRQNLYNIGDLEGYYITNGKAIKIICSKTARKEKTVYKDLEGNVIDVNDGNTFFQICPINADVEIIGEEPITQIENTSVE